MKLGPFFNPYVTVRPPRPVKNHWLGQQLPNQLPNFILELTISKLIFLIFVFFIMNYSKLIEKLHISTHPYAKVFTNHKLTCVKHISSVHSEQE